MMEPHDWDDALHRANIHKAFDRWFVAYHQRCYTQAHRYHEELKKLCADAEHRGRTAIINQALRDMQWPEMEAEVC